MSGEVIGLSGWVGEWGGHRAVWVGGWVGGWVGRS